ncbi:MAG: cell division protein SepF [Syntrophomonadaceae bacterium]|nr:cell division protein SepF [Syntrophomonadaceae bacterium]
MSKGDKFLKWLGVKPETEDDELYDDLAISSADMDAPSELSGSGGLSNLIGLKGGSTANPAGKQVRVVVSEPESFEEVQALSDHLKNRRQIILNFEATAPDVSQRMIDFLSGALYALDGHSQQLGKSIFLFAPANTEITKENRLPVRKMSGSAPVPPVNTGIYTPGGNK